MTKDHNQVRQRRELLKVYEDRWGRPLFYLSCVYLVVVYLEILPGLHWDPWLRIADGVIWAVFVVDWVKRVFFIRPERLPKRLPYALSPLCILDFIVVLSFPILLVTNSAWAGLVRLARVAAQLGRTAEGAKRVFSRDSLIWIGPFALAIVGFAAVYVMQAEKLAEKATIDSFGDAVWWALVTMMTVGYGESYPITTEGKVAAGFLMITGIAAVGWLTAALASTFVGNDEASVGVRKLEKLAKLYRDGKLTSDEFTAKKAAFIGLDQLDRLKDLLDKGMLTPEEFKALQSKLLG
jgi:voltage-gated potassium channel